VTDPGTLMRRAATASVAAALLLIALKAAAWFATDSVAVLSSLLDSLLDVAASAVNLLAVRHALVERVLPDQIIIKVVEREPIGLSRIRGEIYQFDADAMILDPDPTSGTSFPILDGLGADNARNVKKVEIYRRVIEDISETSLSEIRISNNDEVSVVEAGDPLLVSLGITDFRNRWIRYLQLRPQIQQQYPQAVRVDLRFKNQVIVRMKDDETVEKLTWDVQKKSL
jgi:cell division septal protein FtsQ